VSHSVQQEHMVIYGHVVTAFQEWPKGVIVTRGSKIMWVGHQDEAPPVVAGARVIEADSNYVIPGLIDMHIHGAGGADTCDGTHDAVVQMATTLPRFGVTGFLPTTLTLDHPRLAAAAAAVASVMRQQSDVADQATILGLHLEGPYINVEQAGAQDPRYVRGANLDEVEEIWNLSEGELKQVTLAPEVGDNMRLIPALRSRGVIVSLGHTDASYEIAQEAIGWGTTQATHTFNAMTPFHHRAPGVSTAVLNSTTVNCEVIADGKHLHRATVQLVARVKTPERVIVVSDAIRAIGQPDGTYLLGDLEVHVAAGEGRLDDGRLGGSVCPLNYGLFNFWQWSELDLRQVIQCATRVPAVALGLMAKGVLAPGYDADIAILDPSFAALLTIVEGRVAWSSGIVSDCR
jgi:N-acetylglucosamine-6-phosphate deacetylase